MTGKAWLGLVVAVVLLSVEAGTLQAARVRYHYVAGTAGSTTCYRLADGVPGERLSMFGGGWEPCNCPPPRSTCRVTFRHPCTGQSITVPLALPNSTPRMEYRSNRTIYDYGSYTVEVVFLPDGTVDVVYNSGLFRAP